MKNISLIVWEPNKTHDFSKRIHEELPKKNWIQIITKNQSQVTIPHNLLPQGTGVIVNSGGTSGGPHQCFHQWSNLDQSAQATGYWLIEQGIEPKNCVIINPLPMHHVSGFMPWWRSRLWGSTHISVIPQLMRDPIALKKFCAPFFKKKEGALITSLVPTQLMRLISQPKGLEWLQSFDVIWLGGAGLSENLAKAARDSNIRLAPCYGATETAAMVSVLSPKEFLQGQNGCGTPLKDVLLSTNSDGSLKIKASRIAKFLWRNGKLEKLLDKQGWWQSSDIAELTTTDNKIQLRIIGRKDMAIQSGGETVFPEKLEAKLIECAKANKLPLRNLLFLPIENQIWGERIIALVQWEQNHKQPEFSKSLVKLKRLVKDWMPYEQPIAWYTCQELTKNSLGKWERKKWENWLKEKRLLQESTI